MCEHIALRLVEKDAEAEERQLADLCCSPCECACVCVRAQQLLLLNSRLKWPFLTKTLERNPIQKWADFLPALYSCVRALAWGIEHFNINNKHMNNFQFHRRPKDGASGEWL